MGKETRFKWKYRNLFFSVFRPRWFTDTKVWKCRWSNNMDCLACSRVDTPSTDKEDIIPLHTALAWSHPESNNLSRLIGSKSRRWWLGKQKTCFKEDSKDLEFIFKNKGRQRASKGHWDSQVFSYLYLALALAIFLLSCSLQPHILAYMPIQREFRKKDERALVCVCAQDMASSSGWCTNLEHRLCPSQGCRMPHTQLVCTLGEYFVD